MKPGKLCRVMLGLLVVVSSSTTAIATHKSAPCKFTTSQFNQIITINDTIPPAVKTVDPTTAKPADEMIKTVPKVRKQQLPVPVNIKVKPVKIIKPKVIKPNLKIPK
ncbi:MAG: hypothetical protein Q7T76_16905 [Ferruginibacter sp.]|nr:hypothetical protein [Ferruginibacter sp.]